MKRIMIVDDHPDNCYMLERLLHGSGYATVTAANGIEALDVARAAPPDLVISDILMPVMDGFALCREWMKDQALKAIPFIFYTATYTDQQDEEFALSLGAARFILKPQETAVFLATVKTVLTEYEKGKVTTLDRPDHEEQVFLKQYNEALVRKLGDKIIQVEAAEKELKRVNAALLLDIERRQRAEDLLRKSEVTFRELFEHSPVGKSMTEIDGVMRVNESFCNIVGYSADELRSKRWLDITFPDDIQKTSNAFQSLLSGTATKTRFEQRFVHRNGSIVWADVSSYLQRDAGGDPRFFITSVNDITQHLKADLDLLDEKNKLAQLFDVSLVVARSATVQDMLDRTMRGLADLKLFGRMVVVVKDNGGPTEKWSQFGFAGGDLAALQQTPPAPLQVVREMLDRSHRICNSHYLPIGDQRPRPLLPPMGKPQTAAEGEWRGGDALLIPLTAKGEMIGYIAAFDPADKQIPTVEPVRLLELYANQAATAIENLKLYENLEDSYHDTLRAFVAAMEAKDPYTKGHSENVQRYAMQLARHMGLTGDRIKLIDYSALLHDIGKLGVKEVILVKPTSLTPSEFEEIKKHPSIGCTMVSSIENLLATAPIIQAHHEFYDGSGYPFGTRGSQIPLESRIISVVDAFEAMTSDRPYRKAFSRVEAQQRLKAAAGKQFDEEIVNAFLSVNL